LKTSPSNPSPTLRSGDGSPTNRTCNGHKTSSEHSHPAR
jgi:hypothetical protein